jgi:hypothetical protein
MSIESVRSLTPPLVFNKKTFNRLIPRSGAFNKKTFNRLIPRSGAFNKKAYNRLIPRSGAAGSFKTAGYRLP